MKYKFIIGVSIAIIIIASAAAYIPSLFNDFVYWDDDDYVIENDLIKTISIDNFKSIFTRSFVGCYCPAAVCSYALEFHFFKLEPFPYHFTNYILHIIASVFVFLLMYLIFAGDYKAFLIALLFGIHPMHVESVAWVAERKDLMCAVFYLMALIIYIMYTRSKNRSLYIISFLAAVLAFFSKPMAVSLPIAILICDNFEGRRFCRKVVLEKIPFFILAITFGIVNFLFQFRAGSTSIDMSPGVKAYFLSKVIPFYIGKFILPINLSAIYPYSDLGPAEMAQIKYYVALLILIAAVILLLRRSQMVVFGFAFFLITILPVLKIIPAGSAFAADRYIYLPSIGLSCVGIAILERVISIIFRKNDWAVKLLIPFFIFFVCVAFAGLTWNRCKIWKDTLSLFSDVIDKYPYNPMPYNNIGAFLSMNGDYDKAIEYFRLAIAIYPWYSIAKENLERTNENKKRYGSKNYIDLKEGAEKKIEKAVMLNEYGIRKMNQGEFDWSIALFKEAINIAPEYADSYNNIGSAFNQKGDLNRADEYFKKSLEKNLNSQKKQGQNITGSGLHY